MKKRSIFLVIGLLIAMTLFAFTGCRDTSYTLSDTEIVLTVGQEKELTISPVPEQTVTWESSDPSVASVVNGKVSALAAGEVTVTATIEDVETPLTCSVKVNAKTDPVPSGDYALDVSSVALKAGETKQITVLDDKGQPVQSVTYSSDDNSIATVSESGLITAVATGETTVKAEVNGSVLSCKVVVAQSYTYELDKTVLNIAAGVSDKITLITTPEVDEFARPHTFMSSDESVATVNGGSGKVTGVAKGTAIITCLVDGEELQATVNVTEYTVKIGEDILGEETTLRVGVEKDFVVTADPVGEFTPEYHSDDETIVTVAGGHIVPLKEGVTSVTVIVGGREFRTTVKVLPSVTYDINYLNASLNLGDTLELEVTREPAADFSVTFESSNEEIATVNAEGLVTAKKLGTAVITTRVTGTDIEFETTVSVVLESSLAHEDYTFGSGAVNLTYLDANKTLDWRQYVNDADGRSLRMKNNANLVGDLVNNCDTEKFWDYKAPVVYEDGTGSKESGSFTYGVAVKGSYTIPVKITNEVSKVVIFTGSWKETATIEFKMGDTVLCAETFAGGNDALARKYVLTLDTSALQDGESLDLTIAVNCNLANGGNVSLVAVAAIGKAAHENARTTTATAQVVTGLNGVQNLTQAGAIDWLSANGTRKANVSANAVVKENAIVSVPNNGLAHDYPGASFTWTDGTAEAPANLRTFRHADTSISIPVMLDKGKTTVTLFATGYNCGYLVSVYDKNGSFVNGYQGSDEREGQSVSSKIAITLDVAEAGEYTFKLTRCRGAGNVGWAAIAVSGANQFEPENTVYDMVAGDAANVTFIGEGVAPSAEYVSDNENVATVDANGKITAVGAGKAVITVKYADAERRLFVTVTEYVIVSDDSVTLFLGAKSQIRVESNPAGHKVNATYHLKDGEDKILVSESGEITALKAGETTVTVKVDGKEIGQIKVTIANYELNATSHQIVTASGQNTFKLEVRNPSDDSVIDPANIVFASSNDEIVAVSADGTITAVGVGKAKVTATYENVVLVCEIEACILPVTTESIEYEGGKDYSVNLSKLDATKETIDWHYFGNGFADEMKNGSLISELSGERTAYFFDYRAKINWSNGTVRDSSFNDLTAGWTFKNSVSFTVTLTEKTEYIAIFTGAWHAKNTIEVKIGDKVHTVYEFSNRGGNDSVDKNKQFRIYPDVTQMSVAQTVTVTMTCGDEPDNNWHDNISLVAIAVVGKDARTDKTAGSATAESIELMPETDSVIDLTKVGTIDWLYAKNGDNGGLTRKFGVTANSVIKANEFKLLGGDGYDRFGNNKQFFSWSDGLDAVSGGKVNNFQWINDRYYMPVHLPAGETEVNLYLSGWKVSYFVTVIDGYGNVLVNAQRLVEGNGSSSKAVRAKISVNATEESTYTIIITREGDGNHGWAAIAVGWKTDYSLENSAFNATLGGDAAGKIEVLKGGVATTDAVNYVSNDTTVATVAADGTITAVGAGKTTITVTVGGVKFLAVVTVTEYILGSDDSVTLPIDATSQITVKSNPETDIHATYVSSDDSIAAVSDSGLITAIAAGETTITVTIGGKTFTVRVKVVTYKLNESEMLLKAGAQGGDSKQLSVSDDADNVVSNVSYVSRNPEIATVDENGLVTAVAVGTATIAATTSDDVTLLCTVTVTIPDTNSVLTELNYDFENLSRVSSQYKTIDYKHWSNEATVVMPNGANLIGEPSSTSTNFWDYKATIGYEFAEGGRNLGKCYGKTSQGFELPITVSNRVSEVVFYTGAYQATATVSFKFGGRVIATATFTATDGIARKVSLPLDTSKMTDEQTLTIVGSIAEGGNNINVVAVAVVGTTEYSGTEIAMGGGTVTTQRVEGDKGSNQVNLTEVGTTDWIYSHYEEPNDKTYRKFGGNVFTGEKYFNNEGNLASVLSPEWDGFSAFMWTDGVMTDSGATEGTSNPVDNDVAGDYTNNYFTASGEIHIGMRLAQGTYTITAYLNSWKADISSAIYDGNGNFIVGKNMINSEPGDGSGWVVTYTLEVTADSDFTLVIGKSRSHGAGDRQVGWQAIAVAALPETAKQD